MSTAQSVSAHVQKNYDAVQRVIKSQGLTVPEACKKLKMKPPTYYYAAGIVNRLGKKRNLPAVRKEVTVMDLSAQGGGQLQQLGGENGPAIVILTDARSAFSWAASLMQGGG